jgi:hypothetical protein
LRLLAIAAPILAVTSEKLTASRPVIGIDWPSCLRVVNALTTTAAISAE